MKKHIKKIIFYSTVLPLSIIALVALAGFYKFNFTDGGDVISGEKNDPKNFSVVIDGERFMLVDGKAEVEYPDGGATKNTLSVFEESKAVDIDGDGDKDIAVLFVNNPGGSGTFYYGGLLINIDGVFKATNTLLLGDRIAPQTIEIHDGITVFNFAERKKGEPMTAQPSVGKSVWLDYDGEAGTIKEAEGYIDLR